VSVAFADRSWCPESKLDLREQLLAGCLDPDLVPSGLAVAERHALVAAASADA